MILMTSPYYVSRQEQRVSFDCVYENNGQAFPRQLCYPIGMLLPLSCNSQISTVVTCLTKTSSLESFLFITSGSRSPLYYAKMKWPSLHITSLDGNRIESCRYATIRSRKMATSSSKVQSDVRTCSSTYQ